MIFYFSGTGNSRWAARQLAALTGDEVRDIVGMDKAPDLVGETRIGLVFPVYAWGAPEPVLTFAKTLPRAGAFHFAVCTCGSEAGHTMKKLNAVWPIAASYSLVMPNNYIVGADVDDETTAKKKIETARASIERMAQEIRECKPVYQVEEGAMAGLKSSLVNFGFNRFARSTKSFYATDACNGCGLCEKNCPAFTITMNAGKPSWGERCYQCLRCINECPQRAIQYGKGTENRGRYMITQYEKDE